MAKTAATSFHPNHEPATEPEPEVALVITTVLLPRVRVRVLVTCLNRDRSLLLLTGQAKGYLGNRLNDERSKAQTP